MQNAFPPIPEVKYMGLVGLAGRQKWISASRKWAHGCPEAGVTGQVAAGVRRSHLPCLCQFPARCSSSEPRPPSRFA